MWPYILICEFTFGLSLERLCFFRGDQSHYILDTQHLSGRFLCWLCCPACHCQHSEPSLPHVAIFQVQNSVSCFFENNENAASAKKVQIPCCEHWCWNVNNIQHWLHLLHQLSCDCFWMLLLYKSQRGKVTQQSCLVLHSGERAWGLAAGHWAVRMSCLLLQDRSAPHSRTKLGERRFNIKKKAGADNSLKNTFKKS